MYVDVCVCVRVCLELCCFSSVNFCSYACFTSSAKRSLLMLRLHPASFYFYWSAAVADDALLLALPPPPPPLPPAPLPPSVPLPSLPTLLACFRELSAPTFSSRGRALPKMAAACFVSASAFNGAFTERGASLSRGRSSMLRFGLEGGV